MNLRVKAKVKAVIAIDFIDKMVPKPSTIIGSSIFRGVPVRKYKPLI